MYTAFFGLAQEPFSIAPDPRFLYMSERHREALAHLLYGLGAGGGFVLLTGEIGAGKTTVCRCFLEQIPRRCNVAYIFNPELTVIELLQSVCDELHIPRPGPRPGAATVKDFLDPLNDFLLKTHAVRQDNVLIIDEAQRLSMEVLEQLRLLTNLETSERKLLQIILIGQPELREMLARPELEQLEQRVIARYHLDALTRDETALYVAHRLAVAGLSGANPFDRRALQRVHVLSRGVPRRINLLCDRSLLGAYAQGLTHVDQRVVEQAAQEVFAAPRRVTRPHQAKRHVVPAFGWLAIGALAGGVAGATLWGGATLMTERRGAVAAQQAAASQGAAIASAPAASAPSSPSASAPPAVSTPDAAPPSIVAAVLASGWRSERPAWNELAAAWKLPPADGDPCLAAERSQVRCFRGNQGLPLIRRLERPALLVLRDGDARPVWVLLTGLGNGTAMLRGGEQTHAVPLAALDGVWRGEFATFWRAPAGYRNLLIEGATGPDVAWLAARLAALAGQPAPTGAQRFDAALTRTLRSFQVAQGLLEDGIAGPTTLMQINRASGVDEPRLTAALR